MPCGNGIVILLILGKHKSELAAEYIRNTPKKINVNKSVKGLCSGWESFLFFPESIGGSEGGEGIGKCDYTKCIAHVFLI